MQCEMVDWVAGCKTMDSHRLLCCREVAPVLEGCMMDAVLFVVVVVWICGIMS
jgi:hypothetical protein